MKKYNSKGEFQTKVNGKWTMAYKLWFAIGRYSSELQDVLSEEWLDYQSFAAWFKANYKKGYKMVVLNGTFHSPETCMMLPANIAEQCITIKGYTNQGLREHRGISEKFEDMVFNVNYYVDGERTFIKQVPMPNLQEAIDVQVQAKHDKARELLIPLFKSGELTAAQCKTILTHILNNKVTVEVLSQEDIDMANKVYIDGSWYTVGSEEHAIAANKRIMKHVAKTETKPEPETKTTPSFTYRGNELNQTLGLRPMRKKKAVVYKMELENGKYFVGYTTDIDKQLEKLSKGWEANEWLQQNKPVRLIEAFFVEARTETNLTVKAMMKEHGIDNVRGGSWSNVTLKTNPTL